MDGDRPGGRRASSLKNSRRAPNTIDTYLSAINDSAHTWYRAWQHGGLQALRSKGPSGSSCLLTEQQMAFLEHALDSGPAAQGWTEDQRWTLARVTALIEQLFRISYTLRSTSYLLHRLEWSPSGTARPCRRAR
ncbi:winged helix-turn-helix domain-containing protein [Nonomuraea sp. NPDC050478]|uniref:winged helix-turn-helix domain-containing protein n=1 Tax=Nonomuraea sp. NPDC050478 TaxID=3364365 RepID=UPI003787C232